MSAHRAVGGLVVVGALLACTGGGGGTRDPPKGDGFAAAYSVDETTLVLAFTRKLKGDTVRADVFAVEDRTVVPAVVLTVLSATRSGDAEVTLVTGTQEHGRTYTLRITGLQDADGNALDGTLNFLGGGVAQTAAVTFSVPDGDRIRAWGNLRLELTVQATTGAFSDRLQAVSLAASGTGLAATVQVVVDGDRTVDRRDDVDPVVDRRAYAARVVTDHGVPASPLVPFAVTAPGALTVEVGLLAPPTPVQPGSGFTPPTDANPGDGVKRIRIVVDDRLSGELVNPAVTCSFTAAGDFDASFPQQRVLATPTESGLYEVEAGIKVDPNRRLDGLTDSTLPYILILHTNGVDVETINLSIIAPDETPEAVVLPLGDRTMTPVQFRVDVGGSFLVADGSQRGLFPGEAPFLTGEWQRAADALGRNAGDAFTGGEQTTLEMRPDPAHPGVWTKTLWLPPGRPYGWKLVRCQAGVGCGPLNERVASSGRAFATVMKNLATENLDAFANPQVVIVDPHALSSVPLASGSTNYSGAHVYVGNGAGAEANPAGMPRADTLFKQEVPDLAVVVGDEPVITPVYVVGTWRDVNLPVRPAEILAGGSVVSLTPYDYDEGFIGRYPPSRSAP
ncbi:MAG: hypothetical protein HY904_04775 [Deltaproteobacteria bacterium]|nr:hypothetical protein [Deltaproteobacteria bacterium]